MSRIARLGTSELAALIAARQLDEGELLEVLRNPYCTASLAQEVAGVRGWLGPHTVRELLAAFPGMASATAMNLLATLPWLSLLKIAQAARTPPAIRRQAERRLLQLVTHLSLGEKVALARLSHRPLFPALVAAGDAAVLTALLDNPRLVENDVLLLVNRRGTPAEVHPTVFRHHRWGSSYGIRRALAFSPRTPVPLALSLLVQLRRPHLEELVRSPEVQAAVRQGAAALLVRAAAARSRRDGTIRR